MNWGVDERWRMGVPWMSLSSRSVREAGAQSGRPTRHVDGAGAAPQVATVSLLLTRSSLSPLSCSQLFISSSRPFGRSGECHPS